MHTYQKCSKKQDSVTKEELWHWVRLNCHHDIHPKSIHELNLQICCKKIKLMAFLIYKNYETYLSGYLSLQYHFPHN